MNKNTEYVDSMVFETASVELGIPIETVKKVFVEGQVKFTSRKIGEGGLETIMWPFIGKFRPKLRAIYTSQLHMGMKEIKKATKKPK